MMKLALYASANDNHRPPNQLVHLIPACPPAPPPRCALSTTLADKSNILQHPNRVKVVQLYPRSWLRCEFTYTRTLAHSAVETASITPRPVVKARYGHCTFLTHCLPFAHCRFPQQIRLRSDSPLFYSLS